MALNKQSTATSLNIHQSESLVRFVAQQEGLDIDLGIKRQNNLIVRKMPPLPQSFRADAESLPTHS